MNSKHAEVLAIVRHHLDAKTLAIVESALRADGRMEVIRDAFLEGLDHEAVKMIRDLDPAKRRVLVPTSTSLEIEPAETAQILARPQTGPYQPLRLLISKSCAGSFDINDIRIGMRSQFAQSGDIPADIFEVDAPQLDAVMGVLEQDPEVRRVLVTVTEKEARFGIHLDLDVVEMAMELMIVVTNTGTKPLRFRATWVGEVLPFTLPKVEAPDGSDWSGL